MGKNGLTNVKIPTNKIEELTKVAIRNQHPVLGMDFLKFDGDNSIRDILTRNDKKKIMGNLIQLQKAIKESDTLHQFMTEHRSHIRKTAVSSDRIAIEERNRLINKFHLDNNDLDIEHIHIASKGQGEFLVYGFAYDNIFEVLAFDPDHKLGK